MPCLVCLVLSCWVRCVERQQQQQLTSLLAGTKGENRSQLFGEKTAQKEQAGKCLRRLRVGEPRRTRNSGTEGGETTEGGLKFFRISTIQNAAKLHRLHCVRLGDGAGVLRKGK